MAISENSEFRPPSALSMTTSTSASLRDGTPWPPAKITSCIDWPRTASGDCSPRAHSTASVMLDLPEPFGPTITETPGENVSRVRSGNDLKPRRVIELRCMGPRSLRSDDRGGAEGLHALFHGFERRFCRGLLGLLLRPPAAAGPLLALDDRDDLEGPLVRRPL